MWAQMRKGYIHTWKSMVPNMMGCCCYPGIVTKEEELKLLKIYKDNLEEEMKRVEKRISEIEGEVK